MQGDLCLATDLVGQAKSLVGYQVVEADAYTGNGLGIVGNHGIAKRDGHEKFGELSEIEPWPTGCRIQGGLDPRPNNQDGGEGPEEVHADGLKKGSILRE